MNLIPFEKANLPANIAAMFAASDDDLSSGVGAGFPSISIKGKVFHLKRGGERTLIENPKEPGTPAAALEVVIIKANPILSKIFYASGYVEGSEDKPTCYSDNGVSPAPDAESPQSQKCATCPHAVWGSKITDTGKKTKECQDSRRIAIAPLGNLEDAMLLRVPAGALAALKTFGEEARRRGQRYFTVGTRIGFDYTVAHPQLTFKAVGALPEAMLNKVAEMVDSDLVRSILGLDAAPMQDEFTTPLEVPATPVAAKPPVPRAAAAAAAVATKPAAKPTGFTTSAVVEEAEPEPAAPVATAPVAPPKPARAAAAKPAPAPEPAVVEVAEDFDAQLDAMLSSVGFEDDDAQ